MLFFPAKAKGTHDVIKSVIPISKPISRNIPTSTKRLFSFPHHKTKTLIPHVQHCATCKAKSASYAGSARVRVLFRGCFA